MLLEVCVDSFASARAAIAGGADRLELCSALFLGGLSPYEALLRQIREISTIPIRCLMRPRPGDFLYSEDELRLLRSQIAQLKDAGADGFVIGCLTPDGELDFDAMQPLLDACGQSGKTLHRCMDVSCDLEESYRQATALGFDTVLTSGGAANCRLGREVLERLICLRDALRGPEILVGAGVNAELISEFRGSLPGVRAFHMSGKYQVESKMQFRREDVPMGVPGLDEWHIQQASEALIRSAREACNQ